MRCIILFEHASTLIISDFVLKISKHWVECCSDQRLERNAASNWKCKKAKSLKSYKNANKK